MEAEAGTGAPSVDGWVQFAREPEWSEAHLSTEVGDGSFLVIDRSGLPQHRVDLGRVTALDELIADYPGMLHVELALDGEAAMQVVWPESFTPVVLDALAATVPADPAVATPVIPGPPERVRVKGQSRAGSAMIGLLAAAGCVAIVIGVMGLRSAEPTAPTPSTTTTTTTSSRPTSLVAPEVTDACDDQPAVTTTLAPSDDVVCAEG